jgi:hypothetical protein
MLRELQMMKKGTELTMNIIIVAAILLLAAIVIIAIFAGRIGKANDDMNKIDEGLPCPPEGKSGCYAKTQCDSGEQQLFGNFAVHKQGKVCCCRS